MFWNILISALVLAAMWTAFRAKPVFRVTVCDGKAKKSGGRVSGEFLQDVEDVCREAGITSMRIRGMAEHGRIRLVFEKKLSSLVRQRIRNAWHFHE